jgi:Spy/CpxP family protein refolding chaperone
MTHASKTFVVAVVMAVGMLWSGTPVAAQAQKAAPEKAAAVKKEPAKPRGRLPAYYAQVVTPQQREKIYSVQQSYADRIEALQAQLKELQSKMQAEVQAVLTPEQLKKVEELTAEAKVKRQPAEEGAPAKSPEAATAKPATPAAAKK